MFLGKVIQFSFSEMEIMLDIINIFSLIRLAD